MGMTGLLQVNSLSFHLVQKSPVRSVALSVVMLTLLAVYFFLHRRQQVPEIETLHTQESASKKMSASA
jgi:hypothetical protein